MHLGAGALTLARYVAATRPGSRQRAVEVSEEVAGAVREQLPLGRGVKVPVQVADARERPSSRMRAGSADLVVLDVFAGARTPAHLTTQEMLARGAARARPRWCRWWRTSPTGPGWRSRAARWRRTCRSFPHVVAMAEPGVWRGRRFGNVVLAASAVPLPVPGLTRRCAGDPVPARVVSGAELPGWSGERRW